MCRVFGGRVQLILGSYLTFALLEGLLCARRQINKQKEIKMPSPAELTSHWKGM